MLAPAHGGFLHSWWIGHAKCPLGFAHRILLDGFLSTEQVVVCQQWCREQVQHMAASDLLTSHIFLDGGHTLLLMLLFSGKHPGSGFSAEMRSFLQCHHGND